MDIMSIIPEPFLKQNHQNKIKIVWAQNQIDQCNRRPMLYQTTQPQIPYFRQQS